MVMVGHIEVHIITIIGNYYIVCTSRTCSLGESAEYHLHTLHHEPILMGCTVRIFLPVDLGKPAITKSARY